MIRGATQHLGPIGDHQRVARAEIADSQTRAGTTQEGAWARDHHGVVRGVLAVADVGKILDGELSAIGHEESVVGIGEADKEVKGLARGLQNGRSAIVDDGLRGGARLQAPAPIAAIGPVIRAAGPEIADAVEELEAVSGGHQVKGIHIGAILPELRTDVEAVGIPTERHVEIRPLRERVGPVDHRPSRAVRPEAIGGRDVGTQIDVEGGIPDLERAIEGDRRAEVGAPGRTVGIAIETPKQGPPLPIPEAPRTDFQVAIDHQGIGARRGERSASENIQIGCRDRAVAGEGRGGLDVDTTRCHQLRPIFQGERRAADIRADVHRATVTPEGTRARDQH